MKTFVAMAVVLTIWTSGMVRASSDQAAANGTQVCTLAVSGMTCAGCEAAVKIAARRVDGVKDVSVSFEKKRADVRYDPAKTNPDAIAKAITEKSGFKAEAVHTAKK